MTIKDKLMPLLDAQGLTIEDLARRLNLKHSSSLHNKFLRDSLKYSDVEQILNVLGYEITWRRK